MTDRRSRSRRRAEPSVSSRARLRRNVVLTRSRSSEPPRRPQFRALRVGDHRRAGGVVARRAALCEGRRAHRRHRARHRAARRRRRSRRSRPASRPVADPGAGRASQRRRHRGLAALRLDWPDVGAHLVGVGLRPLERHRLDARARPALVGASRRRPRRARRRRMGALRFASAGPSLRADPDAAARIVAGSSLKPRSELPRGDGAYVAMGVVLALAMQGVGWGVPDAGAGRARSPRHRRLRRGRPRRDDQHRARAARVARRRASRRLRFAARSRGWSCWRSSSARASCSRLRGDR